MMNCSRGVTQLQFVAFCLFWLFSAGFVQARDSHSEGKTWGTLTALNSRAIRVQQVRLALDFRHRHRRASTAEYSLANLSHDQAWDGELVFAGTADVVSITVDGQPASLQPYAVRALSKECDLSADNASRFSVHLGRGEVRRGVVVFETDPTRGRTVQGDEPTSVGLYVPVEHNANENTIEPNGRQRWAGRGCGRQRPNSRRIQQSFRQVVGRGLARRR
jgi:hypothetical protein